MTQRVAITGGSGFVGRHLCAHLRSHGWHVTALTRGSETLADADRTVRVTDLSDEPAIRGAMEGADVCVHLAARVHVMRDTAADPLDAFRAVNVRASAFVAKWAANAGVRRFVYLSSIKVFGDTGHWRVGDPAVPIDPYGISKLEGERAVQAIARDTSMALVSIRPPLVYGRGVGGNMAQLIRAVQRGVPFPFGLVRNRRSLVAAENLCDLIRISAVHPAAAGRVLLASDGDDISTPELIRRVARALGVTPRLFSLPVPVLRGAAHLCGRAAAASRILDSLTVDVSETQTLLGWRPPRSQAEALADAVARHAR